MALVYQARVWDTLNSAARVTRQKGTITWASRMHGMILPDTAQEVADSAIDSEGCYLEPSPLDDDCEPPTHVIIFRARHMAC